MHMHVAGLSVFDPSSRPDGRLRFEDVAGGIASRIHLAPRFRQKVLMVPGHLGLPVWVDDPHFDLEFHVRRSALPAPGGRRELTDAVQRVLSRPLDRTKPLWELYVIEGLEEGCTWPVPGWWRATRRCRSGRTRRCRSHAPPSGGVMAFGLTGDWDGMPDIHGLAFAIDDALSEMCKAAGV